MISSFLDSVYFTLEQLNSRVQNFVYGRAESSAKPPKPFKKAHLTGKLHLSGNFVNL